MSLNISASIEISPKQAVESADLEGLFPPLTRVYITDVGTDSAEAITTGARRVQDFGYIAVPHFASRRRAGAAGRRVCFHYGGAGNRVV